jgi:hypothetical protein
MKKMTAILGLLFISSTIFAGEKATFDAVNVILGQVEQHLPNGCKLERQDPVIVSRSPVKVLYTYSLSNGSSMSQITFEQSQANFIIESDNATFESISNTDGSFYLRLGANNEVQLIKVKNVACKK